MKKLIALFLALVMCLSLCACSGESTEAVMTKDEMLAVAEAGDVAQIVSDLKNPARAKEAYCGKNLEITGAIKEIGETYIVIGTLDVYTGRAVKVHLSTEEIIPLEKSQQITVVGQVEEELTEVEAWGEILKVLELKTAYTVTDRYEVTGGYFGKNWSYAPAINFEVVDGMCCLLYFADDADTSKLAGMKTFEKFTVSGKIKYDGIGVGYDIYEAVLVE